MTEQSFGRQPLALIAPHKRVLPLAHRVQALYPQSLMFLPQRLYPLHAKDPHVRFYTDLSSLLPKLFADGHALIGFCSASILVRILATSISKTTTPPAVIAVSGDGRYCLPLLASHRGANQLARTIAALTHGAAAITTASDCFFHHALDAPPPGWSLATKNHYKTIVTRLLDNEAVRCRNLPAWLAGSIGESQPQASLVIRQSVRVLPESPDRLHYIPQRLVLGIGCVRNVDKDIMQDAVLHVLRDNRLDARAVATIASIDIKKNEPALHALSATFKRPLCFFPATKLSTVTDRLKTPSAEVFAATGCYGVAEAAALIAAGRHGRLIVAKQIADGITIAIALQAHPPIPPRQSHIAIIGIGPGDNALMTIDAKKQLESCHHIIGYEAYLQQISQINPTARRHAYPIGEEKTRARHAIALARQNTMVGVVSSGDPTLYAMATLVFQCLHESDTHQHPSVTVHPGVSAMQAASAKSGALLAHDCCAISLSDLQTDRAMIIKRLECAAQADFVIALYNPQSMKRTQLIRQAQDIVLRYRQPKTTVIIARNLYRDNERVIFTCLADMLTHPIDMTTVILIGTTQTRQYDKQDHRYVYTPRHAFRRPA